MSKRGAKKGGKAAAAQEMDTIALDEWIAFLTMYLLRTTDVSSMGPQSGPTPVHQHASIVLINMHQFNMCGCMTKPRMLHLIMDLICGYMHWPEQVRAAECKVDHARGTDDLCADQPGR